MGIYDMKQTVASSAYLIVHFYIYTYSVYLEACNTNEKTVYIINQFNVNYISSSMYVNSGLKCKLLPSHWITPKGGTELNARWCWKLSMRKLWKNITLNLYISLHNQYLVWFPMAQAKPSIWRWMEVTVLYRPVL